MKRLQILILFIPVIFLCCVKVEVESFSIDLKIENKQLVGYVYLNKNSNVRLFWDCYIVTEDQNDFFLVPEESPVWDPNVPDKNFDVFKAVFYSYEKEVNDIEEEFLTNKDYFLNFSIDAPEGAYHNQIKISFRFKSEKPDQITLKESEDYFLEIFDISFQKPLDYNRSK